MMKKLGKKGGGRTCRYRCNKAMPWKGKHDLMSHVYLQIMTIVIKHCSVPFLVSCFSQAVWFRRVHNEDFPHVFSLISNFKCLNTFGRTNFFGSVPSSLLTEHRFWDFRSLQTHGLPKAINIVTRHAFKNQQFERFMSSWLLFKCAKIGRPP